MDKLLEYLALAGAGIAIYFVAENNMPQIKQAVSNIAPSISKIIPVSTTDTRPPVPQSRHCPPGMYADYTDGILTCRDAGKTRELNPHVQRLIPQQQWAYGEYAGNMTQPLVQPDINKQIESQIKKKHQKEVKHQDISSTTKRLIKERATDIYTPQVECPHDINMIDCGNHCMKNGHVMVVDCSGVEKHGDKKHTKKRPPPSITIPPNFPGSITVQPYPEDVGGTAPQDTTGQTNPDWNPPTQEPEYQPEIGPVTPEPPHQPQIGPITPQPPHQPQIGAPTPITGGGQSFKPGGKPECRVVNLKSHGHRDTARWNFNILQQTSGKDYMIDVDVTLGNSWNKEKDSEYPKDTPRLEITSGGPGSHDKTSCCGFSLCVDCKDGRLHIETEDWSQGGSTGTVYLKKGESISGNRPIFGQTVHLRWIYQTDAQGNVYYSGYAQLKGSNPVHFPVTKNPTSPGLHGAKLIAGKFAPGAYVANDPSRVRVDAAGCANFNGGPTVTILGKNTYKGGYYYQGDLGYIESYETSLM